MTMSTDPYAGPQVARVTAIIHNTDQHEAFALSLMQRQLAGSMASFLMEARTVKDEAGYGKRHEVEVYVFTREQLTHFINRQVERHRVGMPSPIIF